MKSILLSLLFVFAFCTCVRAQLDGTWYAVLDAMGTKLPLSLEFSRSGEGYNGTFQSPSQSKARLPMDQVTFNGQKLAFSMASFGITFDGVLDGQEIRGVFNQAQVDFPMTLTRFRPDGYPIEEGPLTIQARPQDPKDFPYQREPVTFPGGAEGVTLAGELTLPEKKKPKAVAILLGGSGPTDRNAYLGSQINHSPFLVLSDYLTRQGYAVLRYDDRGVGESTGDFASATSADMARDAFAAVRYLRGLKSMKKVPIGLIGHSEGGSVAPVVASADGELDFVILLAAPALPGGELMLQQYRDVNASLGVPEAAYAGNLKSLAAAYKWIGENTDLSAEAYEEGLYQVFEEQLVNLPAPLRKSIKEPRKFNQQFVSALTSPFLRYFIAFDPTEYLNGLMVPTLAMNGLNDTQVAGIANLNAISEAAARSGNPDVTVKPMLGLNHLFQPSETGAPTEYGVIEVTFDPAALAVMGEWLGARFY